MSKDLQIKIILLSVLFFIFITHTVKKRHLQIKQSLKWYVAALSFIILAVFPDVLFVLSKWMGIIDPPNMVFVLVIAFMLLILFRNSIALSKSQEDITRLVQELSILKAEVKSKKDSSQ